MKKHGNYFLIFLPILLLVAGSVLAGPKHKAPKNVTECGTIIAGPGKYKVVNDLACDPGEMGIKILASDVKLDLRGHTISCDTPERSGVIVGDFGDPEVFSNVRISNGTVSGCGVGVLLIFTDGARITKMSLIENAESGITLVEAENNVIKKNLIEGGFVSFWAINSFAGGGNWFGHNTVRHTLAGIDLYAETDSRITCNAANENFYAFGLNPLGPTPSSGNLVRGNQFTNGALGMGLIGVGEPPDVLEEPMSTDNLVHANVAIGNRLFDVTESIYSYTLDDFFLLPDAECHNMWKNNMFGTQYGPENCIGPPVVLEDVCATEDDD